MEHFAHVVGGPAAGEVGAHAGGGAVIDGRPVAGELGTNRVVPQDPTARLKGSGMRWDKPNAGTLMALAAVRQSHVRTAYGTRQQTAAA